MPTKLCLQCNTPFIVVSSRMDRAKFCSKTCQCLYHFGVAPNATEQRKCKVCGDLFMSELHSARQHVTCSPKCAAVARSTRPTSKVERICEECGQTFQAFPSRIGRYCSRQCKKIGSQRQATGTIRSSTIINCDHCGKPMKRFACRQKQYADNFCNMQCYLSSKQSGAERKVAAWFDRQGINYQRQYKLGQRTVDFWIDGTVIEVNGCYWHACAACGYREDLLNDSQHRRITSDKALRTYCQKRNIPIITIWEHDINRDNFTPLIAAIHRS